MQFQVNAAGTRIYPSVFKRKVLDELRGGHTPHELGRRYGVPIQNLVNWRRLEELAVLGKSKSESKPDESVPLTLLRAVVRPGFKMMSNGSRLAPVPQQVEFKL
jgi:hypothetical protein